MTANPEHGSDSDRPDDGTERHEWTVEEPVDRVDRHVSETLGASRTQVQSWLDRGWVTVDGRPAKKSDGLQPGQRICVDRPPPEPVEMIAEDIPLDILYEDHGFLVVVKPAGMVVHPAPGHYSGTLVNALLHHIRDLSGIGGRLRPGIVHRLDKDTSGLLLVAKSDAVHQSLSDALRRREIKRLYLAATWGHLRNREETIDVPVGRHPRFRKRMAVVEGGRRALTRVKVAERWRTADFLRVSLGTGRTHQIRVHLAHLGHPVVGDDVYGRERSRGFSGENARWARELQRRVPRQFLHATELRLRHPETGEPLRFHSPLPEDLAPVASWARESSGWSEE